MWRPLGLAPDGNLPLPEQKNAAQHPWRPTASDTFLLGLAEWAVYTALSLLGTQAHFSDEKTEKREGTLDQGHIFAQEPGMESASLAVLSRQVSTQWQLLVWSKCSDAPILGGQPKTIWLCSMSAP